MPFWMRASTSAGRSAWISSLRLSTTSKTGCPGASTSPGCTMRLATSPAKGEVMRDFRRRLLARPKLLSAARTMAMVGVEVGLGQLGGLPGHAALFQKALGAVVVAPGLLGLDLGLGQLGLRGLDGEQQLVLVLGAQHGPRGHPVAFLDDHPGDAAGDLRLQLRAVDRQQGAGEGDGAPEGPVLHRHQGDGDDALGPSGRAGG